MSNATKTIPTLESLIANLIEVERNTCKRQYGVRRDVASGLNRAMDFAWYDLSVGDKSQEGKLANGYRKSIVDALTEVKHSNPRQVWAKICEYAREERGVLKPTNNKTDREKLIASLKAGLKIVQGMSAPSEADTEVGLDIIRSLAKLGVDTAE